MPDEALETAAARAAAWYPDAEDELRSAVRACVDSGDPSCAALAWAKIGDYLLDRGQAGPAALAYAAALDAAAPTDTEPQAVGLRGLAYALSMLHANLARLQRSRCCPAAVRSASCPTRGSTSPASG